MTDQTIEERAKAQGWKSKEEFKGDESNFVEAEEYVRRGEEVLPFVKATNRRLTETVEQLQARLETQERINRANASALEEIQSTNHEVVVERAEQTVEEIEAGIMQAREAGDTATELSLLRKHATAVTAFEKAKEKPPIKQQQQQANAAETPEFKAFLRENPWWQEDAVMRAASIEINNQLIREGKVTAATSQAERLEMVAEATRAKFNMKDSGRRGGPSRVEGGGSDSTRSTGNNGGGKSYSDLPDEAKVACDKAAKRLKIGEGQKYKTVDDWRKSYAGIYFST
jgi:hypothetical protein